MLKDALDKCPLDGPLPDGTCQYVSHVERTGYGAICSKHDYRLRRYGDPYATPLPKRATEPTYDEIMQRRANGDIDRNA